MSLNFNEGALLDAIPILKEESIINNELTQTFINTHEVETAAYVGFLYTGIALIYIYQNMPLDKIHVNVYMLSPDDYGNNVKHLIASFGFSRSLFNKINWNHLNTNLYKLFQKVAPDFTYSEWYEERIQEESGYYDDSE